MLADVADHQFPAAVLAEKAQLIFIRRAFSVAKMVVSRHHVALGGKILGELVVSFHMLGNSVAYLDDAYGRVIRQPFPDVYIIFAIAGFEAVFIQNGHFIDLHLW